MLDWWETQIGFLHDELANMNCNADSLGGNGSADGAAVATLCHMFCQVQHLSLPLAMARPQLLSACIHVMEAICLILRYLVDSKIVLQAVSPADFDELLPSLMPCLPLRWAGMQPFPLMKSTGFPWLLHGTWQNLHGHT